MIDVWACVPVKEFTGAKQRLSALLTPDQREILAATMLEDVLTALAGATRLAGILVNTVDPRAADLAHRHGARVVTEGARDGHTGAVTGMAKILAAERKAMLLTMPGDIPAVTAWEVDSVVSACPGDPSFTIVPAHDELGSNAILCPARMPVPLRFGDDSYFPHLMVARRCGIEPTITRLPGIGLDIDHPSDLLNFLRADAGRLTRTRALLGRFGL